MASEAKRNFIDWFVVVVVVVVARVLLFVAAAVAKREIIVDSPCSNCRNAALDYVDPGVTSAVRGSVESSRWCLVLVERRRGCRVDWSFVITDVLRTIPRGNSNDIYELLEIDVDLTTSQTTTILHDDTLIDDLPPLKETTT